MKRLYLLALLAALLTPASSASATVSTATIDRTIFNNSGSTVTTSGGTYAPVVPIPIDKAMRLRATAIFSSSNAGHLQFAGSLTAEYVVQNANGVLTAVPVSGNSQNPTNSNTVTVSGATTVTGEWVQADNHANFNGISTLVWTVGGTNAIVTFTNNSTTVAVFITIIVDTFAVGST